MTSAFGGQRSIQLSYGCRCLAAHLVARRGALSKRRGAAPDNCARRRPWVGAGAGLTDRQAWAHSLPGMATLPPAPILPPAPAGLAADAAPEVLAEALVALHGKAAALALLARLAPEPVEIGGELGAAIARAHPWQRALVAQTVEDCAAMLEAGLAALGTLLRRGQDPAAPALVLWREFHAAREAIAGVLAAEPA